LYKDVGLMVLTPLSPLRGCGGWKVQRLKGDIGGRYE